MTSDLEVTFCVNGETRTVTVPPGESLVRTLRDRLGLVSVRASCGIGVCGSCTVLLDGSPASGCLLLTAMAADHELTTAEGLAHLEPTLPVQTSFVEHRAFQCSFCIPAMTLTLHALLREDPEADSSVVREQLAGNLCRCGTYPQVLAAAASLRGTSREEQKRVERKPIQ